MEFNMSGWRKCLAAGLGILLLCGACSSTSVTGVWRDKNIGRVSFGNFLVVSSLLDDASRRKSEAAVTEELRVAGVKARPSYEVIPEGKLPNVERVAAALKNNHFDAVLITMIEDRKEEKRLVSGSCSGYWDDDYRRSRDYIMRIGCRPTPENTSTAIYGLKTNLYRVADKALVLSINTDTAIDLPTPELARDFASTVVGELRRGGFLAR
jgi:hypothetical protein